MHAIEELFELLDQFGSYPNGVIQIPGRLDGTAFFPGGWGLWNTQPHELPPPVPIGGSLVLQGIILIAKPFHQRSLHHAGENLKSATWRTLLAFLKQVGISQNECFFTNAYVGSVPSRRPCYGRICWRTRSPNLCAGVAASSSSSSGSSNRGSSSRWVSTCLGSWLPFPPNYRARGQM